MNIPIYRLQEMIRDCNRITHMVTDGYVREYSLPIDLPVKLSDGISEIVTLPPTIKFIYLDNQWYLMQ